jgi:hypothetical protein
MERNWKSVAAAFVGSNQARRDRARDSRKVSRFLRLFENNLSRS